MQSCGKLGLRGRSRLSALKGGRGACQKSWDQTRKRDQIMKLESASKNQPPKVSQHSGTPLGVGTSHMHFDTQDSPWPGLGGSHHLPPYSILCSSPHGLLALRCTFGSLDTYQRGACFLCPNAIFFQLILERFLLLMMDLTRSQVPG